MSNKDLIVAMSPSERKKVAAITEYVQDSFSEKDWYALGQLTGQLGKIIDHPRLFRAMSFGDADYDYCAAELVNDILGQDVDLIPEVVDHFNIDLWYKQKSPEKYEKVFGVKLARKVDFWTPGYIKLFISHLSSNRARMSALKSSLANWGVSAFIAHEDIQASREWRDEVEAGLETMEVLVAVVEPGFKESDWCVQEVGYALGRKVDIIPLRAGLDPFGFFGKYQGIQVKGRLPEAVASEITQVLLRKPQHRGRMLQGIPKAFSKTDSQKKVSLINELDGWSIMTDEQMKDVLEQASLSAHERELLRNLVARVGAFKAEPAVPVLVSDDEDIPF